MGKRAELESKIKQLAWRYFGSQFNCPKNVKAAGLVGEWKNLPPLKQEVIIVNAEMGEAREKLP